MTVPLMVAEVRAQVCRYTCREQCAAFRAGSVNHSDAAASCPRTGWLHAWGPYGAGHPASSAAPPPPRGEPAEPTLAELATNFAGAMDRWASAGFPTVTPAQYDARTAACEACELWDGSARLGLGKCNAPGCGCTRLKRWLTTEVCKHPAGAKWPAL